jgi:hypothetical protein
MYKAKRPLENMWVYTIKIHIKEGNAYAFATIEFC